MVSNCCGRSAHQASSAEGWYIRGELLHHWSECSHCKQVCDMVEPEEPITQKDCDNG
jgi:hypothetical protein